MNNIQKQLLIRGHDFPGYVRFNTVHLLYNEKNYIKMSDAFVGLARSYDNIQLWDYTRFDYYQDRGKLDLSFILDFPQDKIEYLRLHAEELDLSIFSKLNLPTLQVLKLQHSIRDFRPLVESSISENLKELDIGFNRIERGQIRKDLRLKFPKATIVFNPTSLHHK